MDIFFSNLSKEVTPEDLYEFIHDGLKTFGLSIGMPPVDRCEILEVYDKNESAYEYHGVVIFRDPTMGQKAMKRLSSKLLKGNYVQMRQFFQRDDDEQAAENVDEYVKVSLTQSQHLERRRTNIVTNRITYCPATAVVA